MMERRNWLFLGFFVVAGVIGIWHGYPSPNVVNDEMYFVGGVFRALANHTIVPGPGEVPYGILNYLVNYLVALIFVPAILIVKGFSVVATKAFLVQHIFASYIVARLITVSMFAAVLLYLFRDHQKTKNDFNYLSCLLVITFANILVLSMVHTAKVWPFASLLYFLSIYQSQKIFFASDRKTKERYAFWGLIFAWLAFINLPLMGLAFITYFWLLDLVYRKQISLRPVIVGSAIGIAILFLALLINYHTMWDLVLLIFLKMSRLGGEVSYGLSFYQSIPLNIFKVFLLFPFHVVILLLTAHKGIEGDSNRARNRFLFAHLAVYLLATGVLTTWSVETFSYLRYLLPVPFLLMMILLTYRQVSWCVYIGCVLVSIIFAVRLIWLLSLPLTYNQAITWTVDNLSSKQVVLENRVHYDFDLPHNATSSSLMFESQCGSVCQFDREFGAYKNFTPIVIDEHSDPIKMTNMNLPKKRFVYSTTPENVGTLVVLFTTGAPVDSFPSLNFMGSYFDPMFWRLGRLGRNIYIYER